MQGTQRVMCMAQDAGTKRSRTGIMSITSSTAICITRMAIIATITGRSRSSSSASDLSRAGDEMIDFLARFVGSVLIGWMLGTSAGLTISRVFYNGGADQLPILFIPVTIIIVLLASYALVPRQS